MSALSSEGHSLVARVDELSATFTLALERGALGTIGVIVYGVVGITSVILDGWELDLGVGQSVTWKISTLFTLLVQNIPNENRLEVDLGDLDRS